MAFSFWIDSHRNSHYTIVPSVFIVLCSCTTLISLLTTLKISKRYFLIYIWISSQKLSESVRTSKWVDYSAITEHTFLWLISSFIETLFSWYSLRSYRPRECVKRLVKYIFLNYDDFNITFYFYLAIIHT